MLTHGSILLKLLNQHRISLHHGVCKRGYGLFFLGRRDDLRRPIRCWRRTFTGNSRLVAKHVSDTTQQVKHTSLFTLGFWSPTGCFKSPRRLRKVCLLLGSGAPSVPAASSWLDFPLHRVGASDPESKPLEEVMRLIKPQGGATFVTPFFDCSSD